MQSTPQAQSSFASLPVPSTVSRGRQVTGAILSTVAILFLSMDAVMHLLKPASVVQAFAQMGYPLNLAVPLGILELICIAVYAIPRVSVLGAIALTGYLGGAVATHVRVGNPLFEMTFPILVGGVVWTGIYLREGRLKAIVPLRS